MLVTRGRYTENNKVTIPFERIQSNGNVPVRNENAQVHAIDAQVNDQVVKSKEESDDNLMRVYSKEIAAELLELTFGSDKML